MSGGVLIYPWTFKQGFFEMKAKLPYGTGIMSSWFFYNSRNLLGYGCDPLDNGFDINWQEVDVWETNGHWPNRLRNNIHFSGYLPDPTYQCQNPDGELECNEKCAQPFDGVNGSTEIDFTSDYHTFGMYWDQNFVILFVDGFIYRYWTIPEPLIKGNGYPDPLKFLDGMIMYVGTGYGTQFDDYISGFPRNSVGNENEELKDEYDFGDNLYGPDPRIPIPSSKLEVDYFRYWVFIPCENQDSLTTIQSNMYYNQKTIEDYNSVFFGHYETGQNIICKDSYIGPTVNPNNLDEEYPYAYSDQLNLIASKSIHLHEGFHAKASHSNFPIESQFHGKIQTCAAILVNQPMPLLQNYDSNYFPDSFWGDFQFSLGTMIDESWENSGPLKHAVQNDPNLNFSNNKQLVQTEFFQTTNLELIISPNPFENEFKIFLPIDKTENSYKLEIRNAIGDLIFEGSANENTYQIQAEFMASGVYYLTIYLEEEMNTYKILKY
ncbi:MAG: family 16 glycosylhydrolase [Crocinitomicaceae bacterium]|nr:family 16 glycosylhydrolase [Crocinitomicaceae bacterium]